MNFTQLLRRAIDDDPWQGLTPEERRGARLAEQQFLIMLAAIIEEYGTPTADGRKQLSVNHATIVRLPHDVIVDRRVQDTLHTVEYVLRRPTVCGECGRPK